MTLTQIFDRSPPLTYKRRDRFFSLQSSGQNGRSILHDTPPAEVQTAGRDAPGNPKKPNLRSDTQSDFTMTIPDRLGSAISPATSKSARRPRTASLGTSEALDATSQAVVHSPKIPLQAPCDSYASSAPRNPNMLSQPLLHRLRTADIILATHPLSRRPSWGSLPECRTASTDNATAASKHAHTRIRPTSRGRSLSASISPAQLSMLKIDGEAYTPAGTP